MVTDAQVRLMRQKQAASVPIASCRSISVRLCADVQDQLPALKGWENFGPGNRSPNGGALHWKAGALSNRAAVAAGRKVVSLKSKCGPEVQTRPSGRKILNSSAMA